MAGPADVQAIHRALQRRYHAADLGNQIDPLDEAVYILLSKQTQEATYQRLFASLKDRFFTWDDLLQEATAPELEELLRPGGFQRQRTYQLLALLTAVRRACDDRTSQLENAGFKPLSLDFVRQLNDSECEAFLVSLPGIGPKTARCIMGYSLRRDVLAVDTHVERVMTRLGLAQRVKSKVSHADFECVVPPRIRVRFHVNLIHHGRAVCRAQRPLCHECVVRRFCEVPTGYGVGRQRYALDPHDHGG